ncbi:hypothetical protein D3C84_937530 [compost metagenome]
MQATLDILGNGIGINYVVKQLILFRITTFEKAALIQDHRACVINPEIFADAPNHWGNCRMAAPYNLVPANGSDS